jgi:hypothetical protein
MTYDAARRQLVLVGGNSDDDDPTNPGMETWVSNGATWTLASTAGPAARDYAAVAYDSDRGRVLLYGGRSPKPVSGSYIIYTDTWEWDGHAWTKLSDDGPSTCGGYVAYDSARHRFVTIGYIDPWGRPPLATWEWTGAAWVQVDAGLNIHYSGPTTYDAAHGKTLVLGVNPTTGQLGTWAWDGLAWTLMPTATTPDLTSPAMVYDAARNAMTLIGNPSSGGSTQTWSWDGANWTMVAAQGPPPRSCPACAYDSDRARVVVYGGQSAASSLGCLADDWEWDGVSWTQRYSPPISGGRPPLSYDDARGKVVLWAGSDTTATWEWDPGQQWKQVASTGPSSRGNAAVAFDGDRAKTILFGGEYSVPLGGGSHPYYGSVPLGDTWAYDGSAWSQVASTGPSARGLATMAYDARRKRLVLFGGSIVSSTWEYDHPIYTSTEYADTWEWDGAAWTQKAEDGPPPRSMALMAYDAARGRVILYGGRTSTSLLDDTWEWNGASWVQTAATGPGITGETSFLYSSMAYDAARGVTVFIGRPTSPTLSQSTQTWEYDGRQWTRIPVGGVGAPPSPTLLYDAQRSQMLLLGGFTSSPAQSATWRYAPASHASVTDAWLALRILAGLSSPPENAMARLDVVQDGSSAGRIDMADVVRLARRMTTLDPAS